MRKLLAWLGAATLMVVCTAVADAGSGTVLKPYVTLILDTSGSMSNATNSGPPSCGGTDTKLNHARCAINNIVNAYGDMVFAFGRFREVPGGTVAGTCPAGCSLAQNACTVNDDRFELMTGLVDGNNAEAAKWADFACNTCTPNIPITVGQDPEVWNAAGFTPLEGSLRGSERYYQGLQATLGHCSTTTTTTCTTIGATGAAAVTCPAGETCVATTMWPSNTGGFDPILNDQTNSVFLAKPGTGTTACNPNPASCTNTAGCSGANCCCQSQCRPYIVIMLTDGDETCGGTTTTGACSVSGAVCYIDAQCPAGQTCTGAGTEGQATAAMLGTEVHAINISTIVRAASGTVTVTTASPHTLVVGNSVVINKVNNAAYNGTFTVATVTAAPSTQFTVTAAAGALAASTGGYAALNDPIAITAISRAANVVSVTTAANKILATQDVVIAGVADPSFNGTFKVTTAPDTTHFTFAQVAGPAASSGGTASHAAMLYKYRVETHPIGFGVAPGYANIEYLAHAGGALDGVGNEGYYAADESGLELAISQIVAKSLRSEVCNNLDDDCDTQIDEDFPTKGQPCTNNEKGSCQVNGALVCRADGTGVTCDAGTAACNLQPDGTPCNVTNAANVSVTGQCNAGVCDPFIVHGNDTEICNGIDDDCDGLIDEGLMCCIPSVEICDGLDNDCDGHIDQSCRCSNNNAIICDGTPTACGGAACVCTPITRSCGTGVCLGTEVCNYNADPSHYTGCNATPVCNGTGPDCGICDGKDNDCDNVCDGFTLGCSAMPTVVPHNPGDAANNPGDPSNNPIPQNQCHPGQKTCPQFCGATNSFTACTGEVQPTAEICDGLDNDCDNKIDEDFNSQPCTGSCGVGVTECHSGVVTCNAMQGTVDNTCDNIDDDCDGLIDEDWVCDSTVGCVGPNCCKCGTGTTCEQTKCINGTPTCVTNPAISVETCNCNDDDCDGQVDEGALCGTGAACVNCQCAYACSPGEFPCPLGKKCSAQQFCINDPCYGITCPNVGGNAQTCHDNGNNTGTCVDTCSVTSCPSPLACFPPTGECLPDDCTTYPDRCTADQNCIAGVCVGNPCTGVVCPTDQYCVSGQCYGSCAGVDCPVGQRCHLGTCEADPCPHGCPFGKVCNDTSGQCIDDPCTFRNCPQGQWCNPHDGQCEDDPCVGTKCPDPAQVCKGGTCYDPSQFLPDAGTEQHVTVGGGGCNTTGSGGTSILAFGVLALLRRRRRDGGRS